MNKTTKTQASTALAHVPKTSPIFVMAERFQIEPEKLVTVLCNTVIKPTKDGRAATMEEVAAFVIVANQYKLNPFTREIHAFSDPQKGVIPIVGIDGWVSLVNRQPSYNGVEFEEETDENGKPVKTTCRLFVKGRENPVEISEWFDECRRNTTPWTTMPHRMLRHKAFIQCARVAFGLSGLFDEDEARDVLNAASVEPQIIQPRRLSAKPDPLTANVSIPTSETEIAAATEPPPVNDAEAPQGDAKQPQQLAENEKLITGVVSKVTIKHSPPGGNKPWTLYGIKIGNEFYNTFDDKLGALAQTAQSNGDIVEAVFTINEKGFNDLVRLRVLAAS